MKCDDGKYINILFFYYGRLIRTINKIYTLTLKHAVMAHNLWEYQIIHILLRFLLVSAFINFFVSRSDEFSWWWVKATANVILHLRQTYFDSVDIVSTTYNFIDTTFRENIPRLNPNERMNASKQLKPSIQSKEVRVRSNWQRQSSIFRIFLSEMLAFCLSLQFF